MEIRHKLLKNNLKESFKYFLLIFIIFVIVFPVKANSPNPPYFEFCVQPVTSNSGDCTGDGGGGGGYNLNEYYVGQTFNAQIRISTGGRNTTGADAVIFYDSTYLSTTLNDILFGNIYENYAKEITGAGPIKTIKITGYNTTPNRYFNGTGVFATIRFTVILQREPMHGTSNPIEVRFDFTPGNTTDSNITEAITSADILNDVENALWYLWPDTRKPFVDSINYENTTSVPVESNITFRFKDISPISGDETGVNPTTLKLFINDGSGYIERTSWLTYSCSGTWSSNNCLFTLNPPDIGNRNWDYNKTYYIRIQDGKDKASPNQNPAGPNIMNPYEFYFTTENDTDPPTVINNLPINTGNPVNSNITFRIRDLKPSGTHGTGVNVSPMRIDVYSTSTGLNTYKCGDGNTTCNPVVSNGLIWAYDVTIDPPNDFGENEIVLITIRDAEDFATPTPNKMSNFNWSFWTEDKTPPYLDQFNPPKGASNLTPNSKISFHVKDDGVGVDISSLLIRIDNDFYSLTSTNTFAYSGDSNDYYIEITPVRQFEPNKPVAITINVKDNANNSLNPEEVYAVVYTSCPINGGSSGGSVSCPPCICGGGGGGYSSCSSCCPPCPKYENIECPQVIVTSTSILEKIVKLPIVRRETITKEKVLSSCLIKFPNVKIETSLEINNQPLILGGTAYIKESDDYIIFKGKTNLPNTKIRLEIYSKKPIILETISDYNGNWKIELNKNRLESGEHKVFAQAFYEEKGSELIHLANLIIEEKTKEKKSYVVSSKEIDYSEVIPRMFIVVLLIIFIMFTLLSKKLFKVKKK
ncbi:MAG: cohesin domain-containing protein [Thermoplasmata archaeon]